MRRITFFAPALKSMSKYKPVWDQIESILIQEDELYGFVPNANDIWVRDFMPFQRHDGEFLIYRYSPDYLKGRYEKYITNCRDAFLACGGKWILSSDVCNYINLTVDGGNMIKCQDKNGRDCVILTTKILYENPSLSHHEILSELEDCLNAEVILIPWDLEEPYGHSDGMVRSIGKGEILLNCYADFDNKIRKALRKALENRFEIHELRYGNKHRENSWCHINYLELRNVILVPVAGLTSDRLAIEQIEKFIQKRCVPISMSNIVSKGGAMHCISWTMDTCVIVENNLQFCHPFFYSQCQ